MKKIKKYIFHKIVKYILKYGDGNLLKTWLMDNLPFGDNYFRLKNLNHIPNLDELLKKNTVFDHPFGIVIAQAGFGNNCRIYQNVTIGGKYGHKSKYPDDYPKIGNNVTIYANSCIIGGISIGDNSVIAAGSVVLNDVPANSLVAGNPAKIIKTLANAQGGV